MAIKPAINQFNGGELSPYLEGRTDWDKYNYSAKLCKNFIPLIEGSLKRRGGSHFVGKVKPKESFTILFTIKLKGDVIPNLVLNGEIIGDLDITYDNGYTIYSTSRTYNEGQFVTVNITAEGYREVNDSFNAPSTPREYILKDISEPVTTATLTIIKATDDVSLKLNGQPVSVYTTDIETPIVWTALYNENNASGSVYIDKDTTMVLNIIDNNPVLCDENYTMISTNNPRTGEVILAKGKYRVTTVGAGSAAIIAGDGADPKYYQGGAGGTVDALFSLDKGVYSWQVGKIAPDPAYNFWDGGSIVHPEGSYLKQGSTEIANAGGGGINNYSTMSYNKTKAVEVYIAQKGQIGGRPTAPQSKSAIGDYGAGAYITSFKTEGNYWVFDYLPATNGYFAITYIGV